MACSRLYGLLGVNFRFWHEPDLQRCPQFGR
jgi:hypothetical protein